MATAGDAPPTGPAAIQMRLAQYICQPVEGVKIDLANVGDIFHPRFQVTPTEGPLANNAVIVDLELAQDYPATAPKVVGVTEIADGAFSADDLTAFLGGYFKDTHTPATSFPDFASILKDVFTSGKLEISA